MDDILTDMQLVRGVVLISEIDEVSKKELHV